MNEKREAGAGKPVLYSLVLAAVIVVGAVLLAVARKQGWVEGDLVTRGFNVIMGLALAVYGNTIPKMIDGAPLRSINDAKMRQSVGRVTAWAMTLGFLTWTGLWAFAPKAIAQVGSMIAVGTTVVVTLAYTLWKYVTLQPDDHKKHS